MAVLKHTIPFGYTFVTSFLPFIQIMNLICHKAFQLLDMKVYFQSTLSAVTGNIHSTVQLGN